MNNLGYFLNTDGVFLLVLGVLIFLYVTEGVREVFKHTLMIIVITLFVTAILKELFGVPRPFIADPGLIKGAGMTYLPSYPSAHAALAFSVSTIVALHRRRLGIFLLILSTFIAIGRVVSSVHYPSDILFGILIGVTIALFFDTFHIHFVRKRRNRT